ncbi:hypothetical protein ACIGO9_31465 [Nocardia asteroides]|uniref:hypothetical protein n=1 Tax=Nocardia asteroides TaxID=1824 RepID=UPI0037C946AA
MSEQQLTDQQRERFLRTVGWSPDLPLDQREAIEREWDDDAIRMARELGYD